MELSERVKLRIKNIIKQKNISIYELALDAELTEARIRNWYTKRNYTPSLKALEKICEALDIPVSEIVKNEDDEMIAVNKEQKQLLENWLLLEEKQKNLILLQIDAFLDK